jgi:hypothetical protein
VLAVLGFVVVMVSSARIVEPPPGSLPYPGVIPRDDDQEPEGPTPDAPEPSRDSDLNEGRTEAHPEDREDRGIRG